MKKSAIKMFDKVILMLLGMTGIVYSCAKYGEPIAEYEVNGVVTDKTNTKPIQSIRVIRQKYGDHGDTAYTSSQGRYVFKLWEDFSNPVHLKFEDIDGEANGGEFETKEINLTFTDADRIKKERGNKTANKYLKIQNIELKKR
ncbi:MAG: radical SAM-associated putative lipoprotein [Lentimicrobiaceae bacterium]|nr:radical SAM-associated putative lipoprotein [Lentimicrobiaceae bacterium]